MTDDIKATRLSKAAREFNVGISTIVEFLHKKGFDLDPNPNTKLPHEAYLLLLKEYSSDLNVKKESEKLILKDLHRKKESVSIDDVSEKSETEEAEKEEEILIKDSSANQKVVDIRTEIKKPDIRLVGKIDLEKTLKPKAEKTERTAEGPEAPSKEDLSAEKAQVKQTKDTEDKKEQPVSETTESESGSRPGIDIHIVGKIDLGSLDTKSARREEAHAAKPVDKPAKEKAVEEKAVEKKAVEEKAETVSGETPAEEKQATPEPEEKVKEQVLPPASEAEEEQAAEPKEKPIFKTEVRKLSGPTVVGKINLPVEEKKKGTQYQQTKPDGDSDFRRKKKRKRITKEKEQVPLAKPVT
ncbi:MAG: hypothetical protein RBU28_01290, partial [Bacteroidales bacterium]|nr:hypothetical protein [Bacteroidales bacterium]